MSSSLLRCRDDGRDPLPLLPVGAKGEFPMTGEEGFDPRPSNKGRFISDAKSRLGASVNDMVRPEVSIVGRAGLPYRTPGNPNPGDDGRLGLDSGNFGIGVYEVNDPDRPSEETGGKLGLVGREDSSEDRATDESSVLCEAVRDMSCVVETECLVFRFARIWAQ